MGPVEAVFLVIQIIFAMIGVARGYARDLGNTVILMTVIFILAYFQDRIVDLVETIGTNLFGLQPGSDQMNMLLLLTFWLVFIGVVFASYAGKTFDFPGRQVAPPFGTLLSLLVGLLNGYLIAGTLWYYLNLFSYPGGQIVATALTPAAQFMITYLPQNVVSNPVVWMLPVAVLLLLRVRG
jgi:hypothetical protein